MTDKIHIVPHDGEWAIRISGADEPAAVHQTQQAAIEAAMDLAQEDELDIVVHRRNGSFRNVINFETIERRASRAQEGVNPGLVWGLFAAGAATALAVYCILRPPGNYRKLVRRLDEHRPDWLR